MISLRLAAIAGERGARKERVGSSPRSPRSQRLKASSPAYFALAEQSLPITRTELTRKCCAAADIEPADDALVVPAAPAVDPVVPVLPLPDVELDELSVPVTSTRLPTFDDESSDELPSSM